MGDLESPKKIATKIAAKIACVNGPLDWVTGIFFASLKRNFTDENMNQTELYKCHYKECTLIFYLFQVTRDFRSEQKLAYLFFLDEYSQSNSLLLYEYQAIISQEKVKPQIVATRNIIGMIS